LLNKPTISEAYTSTGLTVWSNICIKFGAEQDITFWKINLNKCEKLRTYRKFKFIFRYETYISDIRNISHRNILPQQGVMMSVFAQPDPVFDHGNNSVNI
jgi:hypothetical protein